MFTVKSTPEITMERIRNEYQSLNAGSFSLRELLSPTGFSFEEFCQGFSGHPQSKRLCEKAKVFCEQHGIWLKHAGNYIDCALYVFPTAPLYRIIPIVNNLAIDYFLNDTMGREVFGSLSLDMQVQAERIVSGIVHTDPSLSAPSLTDGIEKANIQVLRYFKESSPGTWYNQFFRLYVRHIETAHRNNNAGFKGSTPSVQQYIDDRCDMSGMHHVISLIEYAEGAFLNWDWLNRHDLAMILRRLQYVTAAIGGLMNDLFSFEKEVIDNNADSNLVAVVALNAPGDPLMKVIETSAVIVRDLIDEYLRETNKLRQLTMDLYLENELEANTLFTHLDGLERCVQASWLWQVVTSRYKRKNSIWQETLLTPAAIEEFAK